MTPNPILKVLSTLAKHQVQYLLMGGQACVFYGAAEFSRDTDITFLAEADNLQRLNAALEELQAECIAVPPFDMKYLLRGQAVHFRCHHPEAEKIRLDIMTCMRGVSPFPDLWKRRRTLELPNSMPVELLDVADLVQAKKTQRDKDWPMLRRLVEAHHAAHRSAPTPEQVVFWLREGRTVSLLIELATLYPEVLTTQALHRPLLDLALPGQEAALEKALRAEEDKEREADRLYWLPLKKELEQLRRRPPSP